MLKDLLKKLFPDKIAEIDALQEPEEPKTNTQSSTDTNKEPIHNSAIIAELRATVSELMNQNKELLKAVGEERTAREQGMKTLQEKQAKDRETEIAKIIDDAKKAGRIPAQNADKEKFWKELLTKDFDAGKLALHELPEAKSTTKTETINTGGANTQAVQSYADLRSAALENLKSKN